MVRLRVSGSILKSSFRTISIPVWCDWELWNIVIGSPPQPISIPVWCDWEDGFLKLLLINLIHFNSSMVRLRESYCPYINKKKLLFQFQYGAIESNACPSYHLIHCYISIPVWCDWEKNPYPVFSLSQIISIPVWCDWEQRSINNIKTLFIYFNSSMVRLRGS